MGLRGQLAQGLLRMLQRVALGVNLSPAGGRLGVVVAVENLADRFYREQFQFAPSRGRSVTTWASSPATRSSASSISS